MIGRERERGTGREKERDREGAWEGNIETDRESGKGWKRGER